MPYIIDRTNPSFPVIVESPEGDTYATVARDVATHHAQAAMDHLRALERLLANDG